MKKLLVVLAIGAIVACNNAGDVDATKDTATTPTVDTSAKPVDTTAKPVDTTAKPTDTSAAKK